MKKALLFAVIAAIVYVPLFPPRMEGELTVSRAWAFDPTDQPTVRTDASSSIPYRTAATLGYASYDGQNLYSEAILHDATLGTAGFVNYTSLGSDLVVQRPDGRVDAGLSTRGYPEIVDERLFVFATNRSRIEEWTFDGEPIWSRDYSALITAFDARGAYLIVGLLDGRFQVVGEKGDVLYGARFSDSRVAVIYGCTVSEDGRMFAIVHGLDPQGLSVYQRTDEGYRLTTSYSMEVEFRRNRLLVIAPDENTVFVEGVNRIWAFRTQKAGAISIPIPGELVDSGVVGEMMWFATTGEKGVASIAVTSLSGVVYMHDVFHSNVYAGRTFERSVVMGTDSIVGRIDLGVK